MDALARPVSATRESATRKSAIRKSASRFRRYLLGGLALLLVGVPAGAARTAGDGSAARPADAAGVSWGDEPSAAALAAYAALAQQAGTATARRPSAEQFYFALPDRFANGDRRNDDGGLAGDRLSTGLDPTDKGFYHGGDIKGVIDRLDYIAGLGTTAIWLAPIFKNRPVQGAGSDISAGYHGYWITDFTAVDPHFGTRADLKRLVRLAHARGIKIYLDIITNHTADVIRYAEDRYAYIDKATSPYVDAQGRPFEDRNYADGTNGFPKLDRDSFPYTPEFVSPADAKVKVPAWLNDPTMYHNRGDSTFAGENSEYGDFFGLDDLFTERPEVVRGMTEIYGDWVAETGVDGFRIDTAKHVNMEFWPQFASGVEERADRAGKPDFFMFGEVFDANPALTSTYVRRGGLPATLDFPFQAAAQNYVAANGSARQLADLYAADDLYTARDTDAGRLPTFLGNHDMGRIGSFIARGGTDPATHLRRDVLAHELMFLTRGQPVVYSGDEQGFTGPGGDKDARQDMFASRTPDYLDDDLLGTDRTHAEDSYDPAHPIYRAIADLGALRRAHPALTDGVQLTRYAADGPGVFAFSRIAADQRVEYLVAVNNADAEQTVAVPSASAGAGFDRIYPAGAGRVTAGADGRVELTVPGTSAVVYRADRALPAPAGGPSITIASPAAAGVVTTRAEVVAEVTGSASTGAGSTGADPTAAVAFAAKVGDGPWRLLGTADRPYETPAGAPARYRIYHDLAGLAGGVGVQYKAVVRDAAGRTASARSSATVGAPPQAAPRDWVVVHYHRPDGNYADWNLYTWGDVDEAWQKPFPQGQPFAGEDAYGRFAWVKLKPGARDVGFLVVNGAGEKDVAADRFVDPSRTGEVWLKSGDAEVYPSEAAATDRVTVHYSRPDGAYDGWGLHLWGDGLGDGVPTDWAAPRLPDGVDGGVDGAYWHVPVKDATKPVNFIVHRGDEKDPGPDMAVDPTVQGQAYVRSGDPTVHRTAAGAQGVAVLHYRRPAGDYAGWGLHVWDGAATPTEWTSPLPPAGEDAYGLIFRVPLAAGAEGLNYILHNGDTKDLPADQRLDLAGVGHEAWLQAGVEGYLLPAPAGGVTRDTDLTKARAHWIDRSTVAWRTGPASDGPASDGPATDGKKYDLVWSAAGNVTVVDGDLAGDFDSVPLHARPNGLTEPQRARFPHLWQHDTFGLAGVDVGRVREVLRGQVLVTERDHEGTLLNATAVQVPGALDDAYPGATSARLGPTFAGNRPTLAVWAPTARSVALELFDAVAGRPAAEPTVVDMRRDGATGVWNATGPASWRGKFYRYRVTAWQPAAQRVVTASVTDPYAVALAADSTHSQIVDLSDPALAPDGWSRLRKPAAVAPTKIHIQELSVRDFSIADGTVPAPERGTYAAFSRSSAAGMTHLRDLAGAGVTHLHLLPAFDFATIPERRADQAVPDCDLAALPPDSAEQQACVAAVAERDGYNWGYDPLHYTVPEGGYAVDPDGAARTTEFRRMVGAVNEAGLRVVMDVVYNHTSASGVAPKSVLDQIVPGYYHRLLEDGTVATSTCCANTAPEHAMMGKLVVDSIVTWAKQYKVDGFRFDLMGHHPKSNMLAVRAALDRLTPARDGVDGKSIYVYGEGWDFGEVAGDARFAQATQANMAGTGIGTFNDRLRDAVRGGGPFDDNPRRQGFGSGLFTDPNGDPVNGSAAEQRARLLHHHDQIKVGLTGNLAGYEFVDSSGARVTGSDVDYNGSPAGYNAAPGEAITYVDAHDNEILYDALAYKLPPATPAVDRARMQVLGLSTVILGQGVGFVTAGSERLRSKSLDRNSFNSGDWFNQIRWDCADPDGLAGNGFGAGLPPRADNEAKWPYARPLLADPALVPDCAAIDLTDARYRELLRIRAGSTLFGLETAAQVQRRVSFPRSGVDETPGVITMRLDGAGLRGAGWRSITVVFNATTAAAEQTVPALRGRDVALHPILRSSADPVLRSASFDRADGTFTVPARSVAVFVQS